MKNRRKLLALGGLWAVVTGTMLVAPGCYGENCNGTFGVWGRNPGEGNMIDENTWESTPIDGKWLHFSSAHQWFFEVPAFGDRKPYDISTEISPLEEPNVYGPDKPVGNFTNGGGNLTELSGVDRNRFSVRNGTCAEYFLRVVAYLPPKPEAPPATVDGGVVASDAGDDSGAPASDAGDAGDASDAATD